MKITMNSKKIIRVILSLGLGLLLVVLVTPKLFLASTPQVNPDIVATISGTGVTLASNIPFVGPYITGIGIPATTILKETSKGVYAGEDLVTKKTYIRIDKGVKVNVTKYTIEGKDIYLYEPEITPLLSPTPTK